MSAERLATLVDLAGDWADASMTARVAHLTATAAVEPLADVRLLEGHLDAVSILDEADRRPRPGAIYGVFASRGDLIATGDGSLTGHKPFCSGLGIVDRALVTASTSHGDGALFDVDLAPGQSSAHDLSGWLTTALAGTSTGALSLRDHPAEQVAEPGWYLSRRGFWAGALQPAACWAGGTISLIAAATEMADDEQLTLATMGELHAAETVLELVMAHAAVRADDHRLAGARLQRLALGVRHHVERTATRTINLMQELFGPRLLVGNPAVAGRMDDLGLYVRQHHGQRDLVSLEQAVRS